MADPQRPPPEDEVDFPAYTGSERRSGLDRRQSRNPQPPLAQAERRWWIRRRADRVALDGIIRISAAGSDDRLYSRVRLEVPVISRPLRIIPPVPANPARRGMTCTLAPGGLGMLLEEQFPVGMHLEVLVRFEGELLAADVLVVSVIAQDDKFLHNCSFTRLGTADRNWLIEYLRLRDAPPA